MGDPIDVAAMWAPSLWQFLHVSALYVENEGGEKTFEQWKQFINNMDLVIPCPKCHGKFAIYNKRHPLPFERTNTFKWSFDFHNFINKSLSKPVACLNTVKSFWSTKCKMYALRCFIAYTANQINAYVEPQNIIPVIFTYINAIDMMYPFDKKGLFLKSVLDQLNTTRHVMSLIEVFRICNIDDYLDSLSFSNIDESQLEQAILKTEVELNYDVYQPPEQTEYICLSLDEALNHFDKTDLLRCFTFTDWRTFSFMIEHLCLFLKFSNVFVQVYIIRRQYEKHMIYVSDEIGITNGFLHRFDVSEESSTSVIGNFTSIPSSNRNHNIQLRENIIHICITGCDDIKFESVVEILLNEFQKCKKTKMYYLHVEFRDVFLSKGILRQVSEKSAQEVFEILANRIESSGVCVDFLPENTSDG